MLTIPIIGIILIALPLACLCCAGLFKLGEADCCMRAANRGSVTDN